jgi:hypothetical protein
MGKDPVASQPFFEPDNQLPTSQMGLPFMPLYP